MIDHLRAIGKQLYAALGHVRIRPFTTETIGKGAGGDKTYAIDQQAEDIIIGYLNQLEELRGGGKRLLIDPIDGSRNAVHGIPVYCTSIAVCNGPTLGDLEAAYVINLLTGDEYWAALHEGAYCNGERITTQLDDTVYVVAYESQVPSRDIPAISGLLGLGRRTRCLGATALDLALLANGSVSIFASPAPSRPFDFAAGMLLIREAGGIITDLNGTSIDHIPADLGKRTPLLAAANKELFGLARRTLNG
jgi:myo-inositol-1(or 4)-monophosphatase